MYSLCAIVAASAPLESHSPLHPEARVIPLADGLSMIPLSESLLGKVQRARAFEPSGASVSEAFEFLSEPLEGWAESLSRGCTVLYVETEYFGGEGFERAVAWRHGSVVLGPLESGGSINNSLRFLGVSAPSGREEIDVVGLTRCQSVEAWLDSPT
jgi:hypothetical protein